MSSNLAVVEKSAVPVQWWQDKEKVDIVKKTVSSKPLTDMQFTYFLELAKVHELNPFLKQITCIPQGEKVTAFVTIDGLFAIGNRTGRLDGFESGHREESGDTVGWCRVYVKGFSHPVYTEVLLSEFRKPGTNGRKTNWDTMPKYMIKKVAEAHALRRAFPEVIGGLYSEEERWEEEQPAHKTGGNINDVKRVFEENEKNLKKQETNGTQQKKPTVKPVDEMTANAVLTEIEKAMAYLELDEVEAKILDMHTHNTKETLKVLRNLAGLKHIGKPYQPHEYFQVSRAAYEETPEDVQEEIEYTDDVPY